MKIKKVAVDFTLNIVATVLPIAILQFAILPAVAANMSGEQYGLVLSLVAMLSFVPAAIGNSLNNVRLLHNTGGRAAEKCGDYSPLIFAGSVFGGAICLVLGLAYSRWDFLTGVFLCVLGVLTAYRDYLIVAYRLVLNYRGILLCNLALTLGYVIGFGIFLLINMWEMVYFCGLLASLLYVALSTRLWKEPLSTTSDFGGLLKEALQLITASLIGRAVGYADRLVLFPLLGGVMVSVYYAATLFGKTISMVVGPINGVMLSYLSRLEQKPDNYFKLSLLGSVCLSAVGLVVVGALARPVLSILYPQFVDAAMNYVWIVTAAAFLSAISSVINPFVIKFFNMRWQIFINAAFAITYFGISLPLLAKYSLMGFCVGSLLTEIMRLMVMILIYVKAKPRSGMGRCAIS